MFVERAREHVCMSFTKSVVVNNVGIASPVPFALFFVVRLR